MARLGTYIIRINLFVKELHGNDIAVTLERREDMKKRVLEIQHLVGVIKEKHTTTGKFDFRKLRRAKRLAKAFIREYQVPKYKSKGKASAAE